jgi:hypothetical protein
MFLRQNAPTFCAILLGVHGGAGYQMDQITARGAHPFNKVSHCHSSQHVNLKFNEYLTKRSARTRGRSS